MSAPVPHPIHDVVDAPAFERLLPDQRSRLAQAATRHAYRAGETVFHEGTPALAVYTVGSGMLELSRRMDDGDEVVVGTRGPGDLVGMRGVLAGLPYANTGRTLVPANLFCIPSECFLRLVHENATLGFNLLSRLARESRLIEEQLVERNHHRVATRTARFLARQADATTPRTAGPPWGSVAMSREEMARLIGTTPETLSRTLHRLAERGILSVDRHEIRVRDLPALRKLAE